AQRAEDIVNATTAQVRNLLDLSNRASEVMALATELNGPEALEAYAIEVNQLLEQAVVSANANFNDEPLFGGTSANTAPFQVQRANGQITSIDYVGAAAGAEFQISGGSRLSPYTDGATNEGIRGFLENLMALRDAFASGSVPVVKDQAVPLESSENFLINLLSGQGALQQRLQIETQQNNA